MFICYWDLEPQEILILNALVIGIPLTIWLTFKAYKLIEKIKNKKN